MNITKAISIVTGALVLFLAIGAFVLSYDALEALASSNGIDPSLTWLYPLLIDGAVIVFSLAVLRGSLLGERVYYPWALVIGFVVLSTAFNVLHAPGELLAQIIAAVPPLALALAFELLTGQIKAEIKRAGATTTLTELTRQIKTTQAELDKLIQAKQSELEELTQQASGLTQTITALQVQIEEKRAVKREVSANAPPTDQTEAERLAHLNQANETRQAQIEARREQVAELLDQDVTQAEIADLLDVSVSTVKRDIRALNGRVRAAA